MAYQLRNGQVWDERAVREVQQAVNTGLITKEQGDSILSSYVSAKQSRKAQNEPTRANTRHLIH